MDGMLSQEEINALLGNMNTGSSSTQTSNDAILSDEEKDAIGESPIFVWVRRQQRCTHW